MGALSTEATSPVSPLTDSLGSEAKSAKDLANLVVVVIEQDYISCLTESWQGQRIAAVDPLAWELHPSVCVRNETLQIMQKRDFDSKIETMQKAGAHVVKDVVLPQCSDLTWKGEDALELLWIHDFKQAMDAFLSRYACLV